MKKIEVEIFGENINVFKTKICVLKDDSKIYSQKALAVEAEKERAKVVNRLEEAGYLVIQNFDDDRERISQPDANSDGGANSKS